MGNKIAQQHAQVKKKKTDLLHFELCTTNFHYLLVKAGEPEIISTFE